MSRAAGPARAAREAWPAFGAAPGSAPPVAGPHRPRSAPALVVALVAMLVAPLVAAFAAPAPPAPAAGDSAAVAGAASPSLPPGSEPEVPVDTADDSEVTFERSRPDTAAGFEVGLGLRGGSGAPRRTRTIRFAGEGLDAEIKEGAGDPLAGAEVGGRSAGGAWRVGRSAPQWGCGWLVGAPRAPWGEGAAAASPGLRAGPRGDLATFSLDGALRIEALAGSFARRGVAALRVGTGPAGVALAATGRGVEGAGLQLSDEDLAAEIALDRAGRWRAELAAARGTPAGRVGLRLRAGARAFRPLLAPSRAGPAEALAAEWSPPGTRVRPRVSGALWRFGPGLAGARGRLEVDLRLAHHAAWFLGVEEQRGTRREATAGRGFRQGWWAEWRGRSGPFGVAFGLENWGRRSRARDPVRGASLASVEWRMPFGGSLRSEQRVYRSGSGEGLRAVDAEGDRVVLRPLSGAGERTRFEWMVPGPAGRIRAGLTVHAAATRPARTQWTLEWSRRARIGGGAP